MSDTKNNNQKKDFELNQDFKNAFETVETTKKHIFLTGNAGSGKSTFLNYVRHTTKKKFATVSPTGLSAININGQTIHSYFLFPINLSDEKAKQLGQKRSKDKQILELELLIIDEISMVRADLLDAIDIHLRHARKNIGTPFGGVQVLLIGDLYQLPPVLGKDEALLFSEIYTSPYFFSAKVFKQIFNYGRENFSFIKLKKIYRQSDDNFIKILNEIREKTLSTKSLQLLNARYNEDWHTLLQDHILLTTTNAKCAQINTYNLQALQSKAKKYNAEINGLLDSKMLPTEDELVLKEGARVMFVKNDLKKNWQNGSLGTVVKMHKDSVEVMLDSGKIFLVTPVEWKNEKMQFDPILNSFRQQVAGTFTQIPLKLAWSITIHKSQGQTFDKLIVDFNTGTFSFGQAYVALSRATNLDGLVLARHITQRDIIVDATIANFIKHLEANFL